MKKDMASARKKDMASMATGRYSHEELHSADLGPHLDEVTAVTEDLYAFVMLVLEWRIEEIDGSGVRVPDIGDGPILSVATGDVGRGDDNLLSDLPIEREFTDVYESEGGRAGIRCRLELGPGVRPLDTVHLESAIVDTDHLVAEDGQIWIVLRAVHRDGELRSVAMLLRADLHVASLDENIVAVERSLVLWVGLWGKDQAALDIDERELGRAVDIDEKVEALGDVDGLTLLR